VGTPNPTAAHLLLAAIPASASIQNRYQEEPMTEHGLDDRHRDKNGEISRKHGNTNIGTLRKIYGASFANGFSDHDTLAHALATLDVHSLSQLVKHHEDKTLESKIAAHH
jgi:hypothetical protein